MKITTKLVTLTASVLATSLLAVVPAQASITTTTVTVPAYVAAPPGVAAIHVTDGDVITISATGSAGYGYQGAGPCMGTPVVHPDGSEYVGGVLCGKVKAGTGAPMPSQPVGELIFRISPGGDWGVVGYSNTFTAGRTGTLELAFNDSIYTDNTGSYTATVTDNSG